MASRHPEYVARTRGLRSGLLGARLRRRLYQQRCALSSRSLTGPRGTSKAGRACGGPCAVDVCPLLRCASPSRALYALIRGRISRVERKVGHFTDAPEVGWISSIRARWSTVAARNVLSRSFPAPKSVPLVRRTITKRQCDNVSPISLDAAVLMPVETTIPPITSALQASEFHAAML